MFKILLFRFISNKYKTHLSLKRGIWGSDVGEDVLMGYDAVWTRTNVDTNVSEKHTVFIFRAEIAKML
jgi:hypothetical protein